MTREDHLAAAARIASRLAEQARWEGESCTWEIQVQDRTASERRVAMGRPATGELYQGTAGIAWFLAETAAVTGEETLRRAAEGALAHSLAFAEELPPNSFGFHGGRVGIAYTATRLGALFEREDFRADAVRLLEPMAGKEGQDQGIDVIGGAAGAIPALLSLAADLDREDFVEMALALGEHLISSAHREPDGWSWRTIGGSAVRHLNGLAHGASGAGLALLELASATGRGRYLFAAEMAFLYERQFFSEETSNWPDLRNQAIGDASYYGRLEDLREAVRRGQAPPYHLKYMTAWCHGSPGIGLARLRAFELTGQEIYRRELAAAVRSARRTAEGDELDQGNFSLCHGILGNAELPLEAAGVLEDPGLRELAEAAAEHGWKTVEEAGRTWPTGTISAGYDPSLLLGEAGIGHFFLRLARPETPTPLLLRPEGQGAYHTAAADAAGYEELALTSAKEFFGRSLEAARRLSGEEVPFTTRPSGVPEPLAQSPAAAAYEALTGRAAEDEDLLADAVQIEKFCFEATRGLDDFTTEYLSQLVRPPWSSVKPEESRFRLAEGARVVTTRHNWLRWLAGAAPSSLPVTAPEEEETFHLLARQGNRVRSMPLGPFPALVLSGLPEAEAAGAGSSEVESPERGAPEGVSLGDLVAHVAGAIDGGDQIPHQALAAKILPQLEQLYQAGFVDAVS